jgi:outer membrane lipoprotein-sorting protein
MGPSIRFGCFILTCAVLGSSPVQSQPLRHSTTAYGGSQPTTTESKTVGPTPAVMTQKSAVLFGKAFWAFFGSDVVQTTSRTVLKGVSGGFKFSVSMQHQTIAKTPGQFRTDLEFVDTAQPKRKYQVISDGKTLWIYRPDRKEFSVQTYKQFDASDDSSMIGLATGLYLSATDLKQLIPETSPTPKELQEGGIEDLGKKVAEDGKSFQVYGMKDAQSSNANMQFWVNPQTAQIERLRLFGKEKEMELELQETLLQFQRNNSVSASQFAFQPPAGAKQVEKISIELFE